MPTVGPSPVRKLALKSGRQRSFPPQVAESIKRVKGAKQAGVRRGNWLTLQQADALVNAPDTAKLKGKRNRAVLALLIGTGLHRSEISNLTFEHIQQRDGRGALVDVRGRSWLRHGKQIGLPNLAPRDLRRTLQNSRTRAVRRWSRSS